MYPWRLLSKYRLPRKDSLMLADAAAQHELIAAEHLHASEQHKRQARRYLAGDSGERQVEALLSAQEWVFLSRRHRPTSRTADIDFIVIHPGGVFVVDAKAWKELQIVDGRIYQGDDERSDALESVLDQALEVEEALSTIGLAPLEVHPVLVFTRQGPVRVAARAGDPDRPGRTRRPHLRSRGPA